MPITHVIANLVRQQTTTTGTGTLSLGTIPAGCQGVVAGIGTGKKGRYKLLASDNTWEVGIGTATSGTPDTFSRDTVYANSSGTTAKITLPAGTHTLDITWDATSAKEATPRLLTSGNGVTLSAGTLTLDCMGSCDVHAILSLTANVSSVVLQNVPERCSFYLEVTQSGGPWTFPQAAWPAGTVLESTYNLYTDTTVSRFWWTTTNGGTSSFLECNGPAVGVTDGATLSTGLTFPIAGLHILDTDASHDLIISPGSNLTADHTLTLTTGDADRTLTLGGNATLNGGTHSGTNTGDQTITLTGDVTGSGTGSFAATIATNAVGLTKLYQTTQYKLFGRSTAGTGNWEEISSSANVYSILAAADYAAIRTLLGLVIGTNVQAYDADLTTWSGITPGTGVGTALAIAVGSTGAIVTNGGALGTPSGGTLTNCTGLPVAGITASTAAAIGVGTVELGHASDTTLARSAAGVVTVEGVPLGRVIASGTAALGTSAISSGASATLVTVAATGTATTDVVDWGFNQSPNGVTGYNAASTTGCLVITAYPTANNVNFLVSNPTASSITPGALTLNWRVLR